MALYQFRKISLTTAIASNFTCGEIATALRKLSQRFSLRKALQNWNCSHDRGHAHARVELRLTIRQEMENNRNCNEKQRIPFLIGEELVQIGNKKAPEALIKIKAVVNHARHSGPLEAVYAQAFRNNIPLSENQLVDCVDAFNNIYCHAVMVD